MTEENDKIIIEVAKLDGWTYTTWDKDVVGFPYRLHFHCPHKLLGNQCLAEGNIDDGVRSFNDLPKYLTSRDAIIPVIEKLSEGRMASSNPADYPRWMFGSYLCELLGLELWDNGVAKCGPWHIWELIVKATPLQLCIALLKATEKLKV